MKLTAYYSIAVLTGHVNFSQASKLPPRPRKSKTDFYDLACLCYLGAKEVLSVKPKKQIR
jgi:hypothetical protein